MAVTITKGKTTSRYVRLIAGGSNLSGDARSIGSVGISRRAVPAAGWDADLNESLIGRGTIMVGPFSALFNSSDRRKFYNVKDDGVEHVSVFFGIREAPTIGCETFSAEVDSSSSAVNVSDDSPVMIDGDFSGGIDSKAGWGQPLP